MVDAHRFENENSPFTLLSDVVLAWLSVWSEVQMICIWSSWCHCHPIISCFIRIQNGLPFWFWLTRVVLEKRPLNGTTNLMVGNITFFMIFLLFFGPLLLTLLFFLYLLEYMLHNFHNEQYIVCFLCVFTQFFLCQMLFLPPSQHCKSTEWWGAGVVICLEHMVQLMSLPPHYLLHYSAFLVLAYSGCPRKEAVKLVLLLLFFNCSLLTLS